MSASLNRLDIDAALDFVENARWAYADTEGQLRCPDCNSNAEGGYVDPMFDDDPVVFHDNPADGAVALKGHEKCWDCGVLLIEDEASAPWELCSPSEQKALSAFYWPLIEAGHSLPVGEAARVINQSIIASVRRTEKEAA